MSEQQPMAGGDFVRVATCQTPTEAHLLKGVLQSAGLTPHVADANLVQANSWMTQAVGGVRVMVPASQVEEANKAIAEFNAGAYQLEGEEAPVTTHQELSSPVFSLDAAALLSVVLTPAFGAAIHIANAPALGKSRRSLIPWVWLVFLVGISVMGIATMHRLSPGSLVAFRASFFLLFVTAVWYFLSAHPQSSSVLATYGPRYKKKSLAVPGAITAAVLLALGLGLSEFA